MSSLSDEVFFILGVPLRGTPNFCHNYVSFLAFYPENLYPAQAVKIPVVLNRFCMVTFPENIVILQYRYYTKNVYYIVTIIYTFLCIVTIRI